PRKREVRLGRTEDRARSRRRIVSEQNGRCARGGDRRKVFWICDEGEIAGAGVLDACDTHDVDLAVPFEATGEPFRKVPELHCEFKLDGPRRHEAIVPDFILSVTRAS